MKASDLNHGEKLIINGEAKTVAWAAFVANGSKIEVVFTDGSDIRVHWNHRFEI